ncbi:excalibur calcium-binding domain-containing protein [Cellulomonas sp.]|uniref:excalibur calcium-binding domain-containing protein n=1 Tax=Cellulomonas sp. TaxID=40001 RepID=UPI003BAA3DEB
MLLAGCEESPVDEPTPAPVVEETVAAPEPIQTQPAEAEPVPVVELPAEAPAAEEPAPVVPPVPAADPQFGTCKEAVAAGYGNYSQGVDPEYDWYQDRDGDGVVCES